MVGPVFARESQYNFLMGIFAKCTTLPGAVMVWGPNACGKSMVVEKVIEDAGIQNVAYVSAREIVCGVRQFLVTIVKQLFKRFENVALEDVNCDAIIDFVNKLSELKTTAAVRSLKFVVVIEDTESLRGDNGELIEVLSRLQDYVQFNICVLFISNLPFTSYSCLLDVKPMVIVNFPQYTKDEITSILLKQMTGECNHELYYFYVKMTVSVFYLTCRDIRKLQRLVILNFKRFVEPMRDDVTKVSQKKMMEVWTTLQPKLMLDFKTLKSNIVPADDGEHATRGRLREHRSKNFHRFPRYVNYLLVASYLATCNPPSSDKRFFVKSYLGKKRRRLNDENERAEKGYDPQAFPLSRLLAIFEFLTDNSMPFSQLLLGQMTLLCQLGLLERVTGATSPLDDPKFKCLASFDSVESVGKSIDIDIKKYLYQYL